MKKNLADIDPVTLGYVQQYFAQFMALSIDELRQLLAYCELRQFDKKQIILKAGEIDDHLSIIVRGLVRKYIYVGKTEQTLQLATEGHVVNSEISFLKREPSIVELQTLQPTMMISLRYNKMMEALERYPPGERLGRLILSKMYTKKDERRFDRALRNVRERFLEYVNRHPHMLQRVPQRYLASYLNIKPETFSRLKHLIKPAKSSSGN